MNAGLFLVASHSSEPQQLCGITLDSRIVSFSSPSSSPPSGGGGGSGGGDGVGANGSTTPTSWKQAAIGMDVDNAEGSGSRPGLSSIQATPAVAPVDGSRVAGSGGGGGLGAGGMDAGASHQGSGGGGGGGGEVGEVGKGAGATAFHGIGRAGEEGSDANRPATSK